VECSTRQDAFYGEVLFTARSSIQSDAPYGKISTAGNILAAILMIVKKTA
jgi:hypothetical protein